MNEMGQDSNKWQLSRISTINKCLLLVVSYLVNTFNKFICNNYETVTKRFKLKSRAENYTKPKR